MTGPPPGASFFLFEEVPVAGKYAWCSLLATIIYHHVKQKLHSIHTRFAVYRHAMMIHFFPVLQQNERELCNFIRFLFVATRSVLFFKWLHSFSPVLFCAHDKYIYACDLCAQAYLLSDAVSRIRDLDPPCEDLTIAHRSMIDVRFLFILDRRGPVIS